MKNQYKCIYFGTTPCGIQRVDQGGGLEKSDYIAAAPSYNFIRRKIVVTISFIRI